MSYDAQTGAKNQVQAIADQIAPSGPAINPQEGEQPKTKVVFETALKITSEQEQRLVDHIIARIHQLEGELGRTGTSHANWYGSGEDDGIKDAAGSFMGKRQLYEMTYHNQIDWRSYLIGGIFAESNLTVPMSRRIAQQQIARASNYFLGTEPWFGAYPVGMSDEAGAELVDKYCKFKAHQADLKGCMFSNIEGAIIKGETVTKTIYRQDWTQFKKEASIAVDDQSVPYVAGDANYIYEDDAWSLSVINADAVEAGVEDEVTAWVLVRDQKTNLPAGMKSPQEFVFETQIVPRQQIRYKGAESKPIYYKDFLAPLNASSLDEADCVVHLYDKPAIEVASIYVSALQSQGGTTRETASKIFESLQELTEHDDRRKSFASKERPELGESAGREESTDDVGQSNEYASSEPMVEIAEVYLHFDADEDGVQEDIVVMLDRKTQRPLFYDYVANRTPNGRRPFQVTRVNRVEGRWHGIGTMEVFQPLQEIVDLLVNRWNLSQSRAGNVTFWNPELTLEGEENPHLELNGGETYTPKGNIDPETILKVIPIYDIKGQQIHEQIEFFMQVAINMSGVSHANDAAMLGMDTSQLATGVRNIEKSGQEMFSVYLTQLQDGLEAILKEFCVYSLAYLDQQEAFIYTEDRGATSLSFGPEDIEKDVDMDVRLELTTYKNEQELAQSQGAAAKVVEFYMLPPEIQARSASLYRNMLKAMQVQNVDEIIQPGFQIAPQGTPAGGSPPPQMMSNTGMPAQVAPNI
jgi:hypothetical protein